MKRLIIIALFFFVSGTSHLAFGQKEVRQHSRKGTKLYQKKEYSKAEIEYRKALEINPNDKVSNYNLANTLYNTKRGEEAMKLYASLLETQKNSPDENADVAHNLGNVFMSDKKYEEAIQAYKQSLRARPNDEETRYNLALAQKLLEQQKQQQQQQEQKQDDKQQDKQDQNKDQQNKEQQQDEQDKKEDKTQQQENPSEEKMSKDNAQKILEAFLKDEKDTQKKVDKAKQLRSRSGKNKKQW